MTFTPAGAGTYTFDYTISDGNGGSDTATVTMDVAAVSDDIAIYVADIRPEEKLGGKFKRAVVEIHSEGGIPVAGVRVTVDFAGQTTRVTPMRMESLPRVGSGIFPAATITQVVDLFMTGYDWDNTLDLEGDSDGDGYPDDLLSF